jgi:hypothetical protein
MATKNMRLTAYISPENWERLQKYAVEQDFCHDDGKINQSPLVNAILNSFFSSDTPENKTVTSSDTLNDTPEISSDTLQDIKAELKTEVIGEVKELLATYQDEISKKLTA